MASLSGEKTLAELSAEFGVYPTMISNWKQELLKRAGELFGRSSKAPVADAQKVIDDLHRKIGQLQVELRFSCRAARHLPIAERRAMIAPEAGWTAVWLIVVQWLSAALGGYLTGRLRTKWVGVHTDEVYFRDTAHGFLAWAVATVIMAAALSSALSSAAGSVARAAGSLAGARS